MITAIYGVGQLGKEILSLLRQEQKEEQIIFIDDTCSEKHEESSTVSFDKFKKIYAPADVKIIIAQGEPYYRKKIYDRVKAEGYALGTYIDRNAYVGRNCIIKEGTIIFPFSYLSNDCIIGENTVFHTHSVVENNSEVGSNIYFSIAAFLGAYGRIQDNCFIGPHAVLRDHICVGENSIVGMGSVLTHDFGKGEVIVGNPAKVIKRNEAFLVFEK